MTTAKKYDALLEKISKNIKKFRHEKEWTQEDMASKGYNYRHYQKLESGSYSPSLQTLFKLAKTFKVDIQDLFL